MITVGSSTRSSDEVFLSMSLKQNILYSSAISSFSQSPFSSSLSVTSTLIKSLLIDQSTRNGSCCGRMGCLIRRFLLRPACFISSWYIFQFLRSACSFLGMLL